MKIDTQRNIQSVALSLCRHGFWIIDCTLRMVARYTFASRKYKFLYGPPWEGFYAEVMSWELHPDKKDLGQKESDFVRTLRKQNKQNPAWRPEK